MASAGMEGEEREGKREGKEREREGKRGKKEMRGEEIPFWFFIQSFQPKHVGKVVKGEQLSNQFSNRWVCLAGERSVGQRAVGMEV